MIQEGTCNPNVTLKGYPKKFWGLFGQRAHKTQQITPFHPKRGCLSLTLTSHRQTYNPKGKPKPLPNKALRFSSDGSMHNAHNTSNSLIGSIPKNQVFSLVETMSSIFQSLYNFSQPEYHHTCLSQIQIYHTSHILWKNLQAYNIEGNVQQEKEHKSHGASRALGIV